ncbi:ABC transporter permease [Sphaerobacter sp.]|uniref:ABC transporter permease n=1 Tax=Sphaerobacter sp. TaxID=2099654 RepID=UPI001D9026F7|nr:ABC transporter permease [Sphaerobacter sp.]MBX5445925.1 ABC transporter permease [Sphaerobacter sp.]
MATPSIATERRSPRTNPSTWSAALNGIVTLWYRDVLHFARDRTRIIGSFAQPILFLFIFGTGLSASIGPLGGGAAGQEGVSYVQFIFPGIIAMAVLFTAVFSGIAIVWDREFGFLKEVLVAPLPRWAIAVGKALGGATTAMVQGILMLIFAPFVGVSLSLGHVAALIPVMFITAFALSSLGLLIAVSMKSMEGFQLIMNFLMMPLFFLSGALFPLQNLPGWLTAFTRINPVSYGVDAIRHLVLGAGSLPAEQLGLTVFGVHMTPLLDMVVVLAFGMIMIALAVRRFSAQE